MTDIPKLLKARRNHSKLFAILAIALLLVSQPLLPEGDFVRELMLWVGYVLVIFGAMGRAYCSTFIGGRKNDEVVREGPFSVVRNPLYVFSFIAVVGIGLQSGMYTMLFLLAGAFMLNYPLVVEREEAFLLNKFGAPYETYMQEVPRWIPNPNLWREPEQFDARPRFIRRTLLDATFFFLPLPCFALIGMLHAHGVLSLWLTLP
jgi:protein-S-isoprenylcysteine O-methyltransferase Ste14